jgi:glycosyltransferase involved in cell wall biosynthesis
MGFPVRGDSYTECFYPALRSLGVDIVEGMFAGRWLLQHLRGVDYVHLHWPSFLYNDPRRLACIRRFALFLFFLVLARWRGAEILWTVHNLRPHDPSTVPVFDSWARRILIRVCRYFLVHGAAAEVEALRAYPAMAGRTVLIDHGHWVGRYSDTVTRGVARRELGIDEDAYVFVFLGLCRPYKNLEGLIQAFDRLPSSGVLVIAGRFQNPAYEAAIRAAIARSPQRIILHSGFVPDEQLQIYLRGGDAVVAPYLEVLTSGTAMLALSFGRPVIAPSRGFLKDAIVEGCGILYDPADPDGLEQAMLAATGCRFDEETIRRRALAHDWRRSAEHLLSAIGDASRPP